MTAAALMATGTRTKLAAWVFTSGPTAGVTTVSGLTIICMAAVPIAGKMAEGMKVST